MPNKVRFGASNVHYALETENGFGEWKKLAGTVQISFDPQGSQSTFYADNVGYWIATPSASDSISIELADMTDQAKIDLLGYIQDATSGLLCEPVMATRKPFALGYQVEGDGNHLRGVRYGGTLNRPSEAHNTTTDSTDPDTITIEGTFVGKSFTIGSGNDAQEIAILGAGCTDEGTTHTAYDNFWTKVPQPGVAA